MKRRAQLTCWLISLIMRRSSAAAFVLEHRNELPDGRYAMFRGGWVDLRAGQKPVVTVDRYGRRSQWSDLAVESYMLADR